jgi:hypothetical protein
MGSDTEEKSSCFVIMPISDPEEYKEGHFLRVYNHLIKPACNSAGLTPIRADDVKSTNYIVLDILKRTIESKMVLCDLSSRNPYVLYELGVRQAFNLPVVLIKDKRTSRVFDIQGFRTFDYDESLRIDTVESDVAGLSQALKKTLEQKGADINSLVQLLGITQAELSDDTPVSPETTLVLATLKDISNRILNIEQQSAHPELSEYRRIREIYTLPNGERVHIGEKLIDISNGSIVGKFRGKTLEGIIVTNEDGSNIVIPPDSEIYDKLALLHFLDREEGQGR